MRRLYHVPIALLCAVSAIAGSINIETQRSFPTKWSKPTINGGVTTLSTPSFSSSAPTEFEIVNLGSQLAVAPIVSRVRRPDTPLSFWLTFRNGRSEQVQIGQHIIIDGERYRVDGNHPTALRLRHQRSNKTVDLPLGKPVKLQPPGDTQRAQKAIRQLCRGSRKQRSMAQNVLRDDAAAAVPAINNAMSTLGAADRLRCIELLGKLAHSDETLADISLNDTSSRVRKEAATQLRAAHTDAARQRLLDAAQASSGKTRRRAADVIQHIGDRYYVADLISMLAEHGGTAGVTSQRNAGLGINLQMTEFEGYDEYPTETRVGNVAMNQVIRVPRTSTVSVDTHVQVSVRSVLTRLTATDHGADVDRWQRWFDEAESPFASR